MALREGAAARLRTNGESFGWISIPSGTLPSARSEALSRPHIAEASTGAGACGARRVIAANGVLGTSPSACIADFCAAQSRSSSSRVTVPSRTSLSP